MKKALLLCMTLLTLIVGNAFAADEGQTYTVTIGAYSHGTVSYSLNEGDTITVEGSTFQVTATR